MALQNLDSLLDATGGGLNSGNIRSTSTSFKTYNSDEEGAQDHIRLLGVYQKKHGLNTISGVVDRWAPESDNNTHNDNYKQYIANSLGIGINDKIDLTDPEVAGQFAHAQAEFEHGKNKVHHDSSWYVDQAYNRQDDGVVQHATAAKKSSLPNLDDQIEEQPLQSLDDQLEEVKSAPTINAQPKENSTGIWHNIGGGFHELGKDTVLALLGTRDKADWEHPLNYLSPYKDMSEVTPEQAHNAQVIQGVGKKAIPIAAFAAADMATGGALTPLAGELLPEVVAPIASRVIASGVGSTAAQETESMLEGKGLVVPDAKTTALDVAGGEVIQGVGKVIKAGSEAARTRISNVVNDNAHVHRNLMEAEQNVGSPTYGMNEAEAGPDAIRQSSLDQLEAAQSEIPSITPHEVLAKSQGKLIKPDLSKFNREEIGMSRTQKAISSVGSVAEHGIPGMKLARDVSEKGVQKTLTDMGKEGVWNAVKHGNIAALFTPLTHALAVTGAKISAPLAAAKQVVDRSHIRDIERVLSNKDLTGDQIRNQVGSIIQKIPGNAPSEALTDKQKIKQPKRPAVADPTREAKSDESYYNEKGEPVIVISKGR